jgi:hypothetical protein
LYLELSFLFCGNSICVPPTSIFPLKPLSVGAIWGLVPPIFFQTRALWANDSYKELLLCGLPENLFIAVITPVCLSVTTHPFVPNS